jgi:hypothetical protein
MSELPRATSPPSLSRAASTPTSASTLKLPRAASTSLTPPHAGAPEGHLAAINEENTVEVTPEEAVEVTGKGDLGGGKGGLGGGGEAERVTADREAQGGAAKHGRRGQYEQREPRWMGARAKEIMMLGEYRGDKDDNTLLFFNFFSPWNDDPHAAHFKFLNLLLMPLS